jgi:hypothetical protein
MPSTSDFCGEMLKDAKVERLLHHLELDVWHPFEVGEVLDPLVTISAVLRRGLKTPLRYGITTECGASPRQLETSLHLSVSTAGEADLVLRIGFSSPVSEA